MGTHMPDDLEAKIQIMQTPAEKLPATSLSRRNQVIAPSTFDQRVSSDCLGRAIQGQMPLNFEDDSEPR